MTQSPASGNADVAQDVVAPLESILCTEELARRPWRQPDYKKANHALTRLARAMVDSPQSLLQTLAETILDVTQADSAGLSLLTRIDGEDRFYWPAIAGMWKPHIGGGTPRHFGPCGDVLDRNEPLLFRHPERRYHYLRPVMPPAVECLLIPFSIGNKTVGTVWATAHDEGRKFDAEDQRLMSELGHFASAAYDVLTRNGRPQTSPPSDANGAERRSAATPTLREREVLALLASGFSYHEAARQLSVTAKTVETYRARAARKLGLKSRAELVAYALRTGILGSPPR